MLATLPADPQARPMNDTADRWIGPDTRRTAPEPPPAAAAAAPEAEAKTDAATPRPERPARRAKTVTTDDPRAGFDRRGTGHGMLNAGGVTGASRFRVALRHIGLRLIAKLPGTRFKSRLIRKLFNVQMGEDVGLAYHVGLDPYDPSLISFGDRVLVGTETRFFVHVFTLNRQRVRPITVGSDVMIGAFCVIAPGVTIGDGASIAPGTIVNRDVLAGAIVTGNQMHIRRRDAAA